MTVAPPSPAIAAARTALATGDWPRAAGIAEGMLKAAPDVADARFVLGIALAETGHIGHALGQIERAHALAPDNAEYAAQLARLLVLLRRDADAMIMARRAATLPGKTPLVADTIGCVLARLGDHGAALPLFAEAVAGEPNNLSFRFNHASSLGFFGRTTEAAHEYEAMIVRDPANGKAHYGLAMLARQTAALNHIGRIEAALPLVADHDERVRLLYAAAKEHEDLGHADAAFAHLYAANRQHRARIGYDPAVDAGLGEAIMAAFSDPTYLAGEGDGEAAPLFVIGLPRTGTTLVDRILDAHPLVQSLGELQAMPLAVKRASRSSSRLVLDPDTLSGMAGADPRALGMDYMAQAMQQAGAGQGIVLDKFPLNFLYVGHIARALPRARIVCLRRHPLDAVWSNVKHLFALNSPYYGYSYDLADAARYYVLFDRLMAFWRERFPGLVHEVGYEALIDHQEAETRALLNHCGLPWDAACLDFHHASGAVATPSAQQVRRPLNRDSVGRWRDYERHMGPAMDVLNAAGIAF